MDLDSALLRAFVALSDELHFGRAAQALFITQQALSKRIARLESLLGVRLVDRGGRSIALTAAGERLLPEARRAVDAIDAATQSASPQTDALTVDVLDERLSMLPRVRALASQQPDLQLSTVMRHGRDALEMLRADQTDVVLGRPGHMASPWPPDIGGRAILAEPLELLVPLGHALDKDAVTVAELRDQPLWFPTRSAPAEWTEFLDELVAEFHLRVDQSGATFGFDHWLEQVTHSLAPPTLVGAAMELPAGLPLARVPITHPTPVFWWWAMWRTRRGSSTLDAFVSAVTGKWHQNEDLWMPARDAAFHSGRRADQTGNRYGDAGVQRLDQ